jgi:hypothetical protein
VTVTKVYPVAGFYINGVPHVAHECDDEFCTASGAFTPDPPPDEAEPTEGPADAGPPDSTED